MKLFRLGNGFYRCIAVFACVVCVSCSRDGGVSDYVADTDFNPFFITDIAGLPVKVLPTRVREDIVANLVAKSRMEELARFNKTYDKNGRLLVDVNLFKGGNNKGLSNVTFQIASATALLSNGNSFTWNAYADPSGTIVSPNAMWDGSIWLSNSITVVPTDITVTAGKDATYNAMNSVGPISVSGGGQQGNLYYSITWTDQYQNVVSEDILVPGNTTKTAPSGAYGDKLNIIYFGY
jgi:hypothetical protein